MSARKIHDRSTAPNSGDWADHALGTLREQRVRAGGARAAVIDLLAGQDCCLTAQEIWERLRRRRHAASLASVYRAVELLGDMGLVQRIDVGGGVARYEPARPGGEHHHHVVCDTCGAITAFEDEGLEEAIEGLARRLRHRVSAHEVVIRGSCPNCAGGTPVRAGGP
jgi:Fur family transcriptional regulator, ferric uptake regulator